MILDRLLFCDNIEANYNIDRIQAISIILRFTWKVFWLCRNSRYTKMLFVSLSLSLFCSLCGWLNHFKCVMYLCIIHITSNTKYKFVELIYRQQCPATVNCFIQCWGPLACCVLCCRYNRNKPSLSTNLCIYQQKCFEIMAIKSVW